MIPAAGFRRLAFAVLLAVPVGCASPRHRDGPAGSDGAAADARTKSFRLPARNRDGPRLRIDLPEGFVLDHHKGPDFDVVYFRNEPSRLQLGIYVGHFPALSTTAPNAPRHTVHAGTVDGTAVRWRRWSDGNGSHAEALTKGLLRQRTAGGAPGPLVHLFLSGPTDADVDRLEAAASTLRRE